MKTRRPKMYVRNSPQCETLLLNGPSRTISVRPVATTLVYDGVWNYLRIPRHSFALGKERVTAFKNAADVEVRP